MAIEPDPQLEEFVHRRLRGLPEVEAPRTLIARVLAAIERPVVQPWWKRSWWNWPLAAQATALVVFLVCAAALSWVSTAVSPATESLNDAMVQRFSLIGTLGNALAVLANALAVLLQSLADHSWALAIGVGCVAMYLFSVGAGTLLVRVVIKQSGELDHEK